MFGIIIFFLAWSAPFMQLSVSYLDNVLYGTILGIIFIQQSWYVPYEEYITRNIVQSFLGMVIVCMEQSTATEIVGNHSTEYLDALENPISLTTSSTSSGTEVTSKVT